MKAPIVVLVVAHVLGLLVACGPDKVAATIDGPIQRDVALTASDGAIDRALLDGPVPDRALPDSRPDHGVVDGAAVDGGVTVDLHAPADGPPPDTSPDTIKPDVTSCHTCPLVAATKCSTGVQRTCALDTKGCRNWVATTCPKGFCTKDTCGSCNLDCNPSAAGCLWTPNSCGEILLTGGPITELAANSEGVFWNRAAYQANSGFMQLPTGKKSPVLLKGTANLAMSVFAGATAAFGQTFDSHSQLLIKDKALKLKSVDAWSTGSLVFANQTHGYFTKTSGATTRLYRNAIPATCTAGSWCWIGAGAIFYAGSSEWPASLVSAGDATTLYFRSNRYGNYPINDIKRNAWRIYKRPLNGGTLTQVLHSSGKFGPSGLARDGDYLYYLLNSSKSHLSRIHLPTGKKETVYYASKSAAPLIYHFVVGDGEVFWLDSANTLKRLRQGDKTPVQLLSKLSYTNIALTKDAVYVTAAAKTKLIRWRR